METIASFGALLRGARAPSTGCSAVRTRTFLFLSTLREPIPCKTGKAMLIRDSFIAATAMVHGLAVVTQNYIDFSKAGVHVIDPFVT